MSLISQAIKNLKGGISQQPDILRFDDQGAEQVNAFSSEVEGLQKRPPTVFVKRLAEQSAFGVNPLVHIINRDASEQYAAVFTGNDLAVYDLKTGDRRHVAAPNGWGYIQTSNPREDLRMVTVADYTFIVNRTVTVNKGTSVSPTHYPYNRTALIILKGGQYGRKFTVTINGSKMAEFETPLGDKAEDSKQIDIQYILGQLGTQLSNAIAQQGGSVEVREGYIFLTMGPDRPISSLKVTDGYNGQLMQGITSTVQNTTHLPVYAPDWYQIRISGEAGSGQDDYFVYFDPARNVWTECPAPNMVTDFNNATMPWILISQADGSFELKQAEWSPRLAGDDETNPYPSFVDQKLTDIFFFRNRLGFLSGENVVMSEAASYFNFFVPSVAVLGDSDPIDVAVSTNRISILRHAVPFAEELLLWSDSNQFVMGADGILTPSSVKLDLTTEFEVSKDARPLGIGRGVYFVSPRASFSSIRRYYAVQDVTNVKNAEDMTAHVPSYIPNGVFNLSGSSTENFVTVLTSGAPNKVFMYKFLYLEENLAQQSWSHWDFGPEVRVLSASMVNSIMYLILDTASGIYLEKLTFTQNTLDFSNEPYRLYMDRKMQIIPHSGAYNWDTNKTTLSLGSIYGSPPKYGNYLCVLENGTLFKFTPPNGGWQTNDLIQFDGNLEGVRMFIGEAYEMKYRFSKFLIKTSDAQGGVATEDIGRLQLRRGWVNYESSGNFGISVESKGRLFTYGMTGARLGSRDFLLGFETLDTGQLRFPLAGNAKTIDVTLKSDTPNPVAIIGAGWEGNYIRRSSGI